ncbi:hypothetical protein ACFL21_01585 [Patescibacteria group bacterium]
MRKGIDRDPSSGREAPRGEEELVLNKEGVPRCGRREFIRRLTSGLVVGALALTGGCKGGNRKEAKAGEQGEEKLDVESGGSESYGEVDMSKGDAMSDTAVELVPEETTEKLIFECVQKGMGRRASSGQEFESECDLNRSAKIRYRSTEMDSNGEYVGGRSTYRLQIGHVVSGEERVACLMVTEFRDKRDKKGKAIRGKDRKIKKTQFFSFRTLGLDDPELTDAKIMYSFPYGKSYSGVRKTFRWDEDENDWIVVDQLKKYKLDKEQSDNLPDNIENTYYQVLKAIREYCLEWKEEEGLE